MPEHERENSYMLAHSRIREGAATVTRILGGVDARLKEIMRETGAVEDWAAEESTQAAQPWRDDSDSIATFSVPNEPIASGAAACTAVLKPTVSSAAAERTTTGVASCITNFGGAIAEELAEGTVAARSAHSSVGPAPASRVELSCRRS